MYPTCTVTHSFYGHLELYKMPHGHLKALLLLFFEQQWFVSFCFISLCCCVWCVCSHALPSDVMHSGLQAHCLFLSYILLDHNCKYAPVVSFKFFVWKQVGLNLSCNNSLWGSHVFRLTTLQGFPPISNVQFFLTPMWASIRSLMWDAITSYMILETGYAIDSFYWMVS